MTPPKDSKLPLMKQQGANSILGRGDHLQVLKLSFM